jgi:hypothetical protein
LVNDPDAELAEELARETLATDGLKLILSLSTADAAPAPSFGLDTRVPSLSLPALSDEKSGELLKAAGGELDFSLESWVVENAGGVPGVILAAAQVGAELRRDGGTFLDQVARGFEQKAQQRLSSSEQQALRYERGSGPDRRVGEGNRGYRERFKASRKSGPGYRPLHVRTRARGRGYSQLRNQATASRANASRSSRREKVWSASGMASRTARPLRSSMRQRDEPATTSEYWAAVRSRPLSTSRMWPANASSACAMARSIRAPASAARSAALHAVATRPTPLAARRAASSERAKAWKSNSPAAILRHNSGSHRRRR